jgi:hypothetical protein
MSPRALALLALLLGLGTTGAFVTLLAAFAIPPPPVSYLGALGLAVVLALAAVWRAPRWLTVSALVVSVLLLAMASFLNFVAWRVPAGHPLVAVGQTVPDFTLPDAAGRPVTLSDYRGQKPVVLVFYRGYW